MVVDFPEQQAEYEWLVERWRDFEHRSFPQGLGGVEVNGVCLVTLDYELSNVARAFVKTRRLKPGAIEVLRRLHNDLLLVLPSLTGGGAAYFCEWNELVMIILDLLKREAI